MMACQCRHTDSNQWQALGQDVGSGGGCVCRRQCLITHSTPSSILLLPWNNFLSLLYGMAVWSNSSQKWQAKVETDSNLKFSVWPKLRAIPWSGTKVQGEENTGMGRCWERGKDIPKINCVNFFLIENKVKKYFLKISAWKLSVNREKLETWATYNEQSICETSPHS